MLKVRIDDDGQYHYTISRNGRLWSLSDERSYVRVYMNSRKGNYAKIPHQITIIDGDTTEYKGIPDSSSKLKRENPHRIYLTPDYEIEFFDD